MTNLFALTLKEEKVAKVYNYKTRVNSIKLNHKYFIVDI
jgi:hypothetical protein